MPSTNATVSSPLASAAVRIAALWVLAVSLTKLATGSPADLPAPVLQWFSFFGPDLVFRLSIAVELSVALGALILPALFWHLLAALFLLFVAVLVQLVLAGAESCGCFGQGLSMPPAVMLAIDVVCLVAILAARPWSRLPAARPRVARAALLGLALLSSWAAPWLAISPQASPLPAAGPGPWQPPSPLPRYAVLDPEKWVGKPIAETQLAAWMDVTQVNQDALWILYRVNCERCAEHLRALEAGFAENPAFYVFVRLPEKDDEAQRVVESLPPGEEVVLPRLEKGYFIQTPWELELEGGVVRSARQARDEG